MLGNAAWTPYLRSAGILIGRAMILNRIPSVRIIGNTGMMEQHSRIHLIRIPIRLSPVPRHQAQRSQMLHLAFGFYEVRQNSYYYDREHS